MLHSDHVTTYQSYLLGETRHVANVKAPVPVRQYATPEARVTLQDRGDWLTPLLMHDALPGGKVPLPSFRHVLVAPGTNVSIGLHWQEEGVLCVELLAPAIGLVVREWTELPD